MGLSQDSLNNLNTLANYRYEHYLPSAFDDSLSYLEKLNKLIQIVNELALNNVSDDIIKSIMDAWLQDGTLANILKPIYGALQADFVESFHYDEITTKEYKDNPNGYYLVTTIPTKDVDGNPIILEKGIANDNLYSGKETGMDFTNRTGASLTVNASVFVMEDGAPLGIHIKDGIVLNNTNNNGSPNWTLGYNRITQELDAYPPSFDGNTLKTFGVTDAWGGFFPLIQNYINTPQSLWEVVTPGHVTNTLDQHPRQVIAQKADKTILIFTFRGREDDHLGFTYPQMQDVLQSFGVKFAYNLDGGGSTTTIKDNVFMNVPLDENYRADRPVIDFIYVKKPTTKSYEDMYKMLGDLSLVVKKLDARHISKYGDRIPGKLTFDDFVYFANGIALYGTRQNGDVERIAGLYPDGTDDRIYVGDADIPLSIQASANIAITLGNDASTNYRMNVHSTASWSDCNLQNGWTHLSGRELQYKRENSFETRIRGAAVCGTADKSGTSMYICILPPECTPTRTMVIPCSIISGGREANDVIIYPDGKVILRFPVTAPTVDTAVQIECVINRES